MHNRYALPSVTSLKSLTPSIMRNRGTPSSNLTAHRRPSPFVMLHISIEAMILTNGPILINLSEDLCQKKAAPYPYFVGAHCGRKPAFHKPPAREELIFALEPRLPISPSLPLVQYNL